MKPLAPVTVAVLPTDICIVDEAQNLVVMIEDVAFNGWKLREARESEVTHANAILFVSSIRGNAWFSRPE